MNENLNDRFGIDEALICQVIAEHHGLIRDGCYIPTRAEVATEDAVWLYGILIGWWWESPTALAPTWRQVQDVLAILRQREDSGSHGIRRILAEAPTVEDFLD